MLYIDYNNPFDQLRKIAFHLGADFKENEDSAILELNNRFGKGQIITYNIFKGLCVRVYNITFFEEIKISKQEYAANTIYFLYCVKGHFFHKFESETQEIKISQKQNIILSSITNVPNEITFPANVEIGMSAIFLKQDLTISDKKRRTILESAIEDITAFIDKQKPFSYYGEISPITNKYAKIVVENKRKDAVGKLLVEGAVINTLASQIEHHDKHKDFLKIGTPLTNTETLKISELAEYIADNIDKNLKIKDLSTKFSLSPKKLQAGSRYLFGESLGNFITHLRLEKGKEIIQHTDLSISEVCYKVGFSSRSYFSKSFAERFGVLPSEFKNSLMNDSLVYQLTYKSTMVDDIGVQDIEDIESEAIEHNSKHDITGCLVCKENNFFQILEGSKTDVLSIYDKIKKDHRHFDVQLISRKFNSNRLFPKWSMALISNRDKLWDTFEDRAINLNIDDELVSEKEMNMSNTIFWRKVLNFIIISKTESV
ncbi:BLUF domain-containing protein [Maribacter sp. X9]|uniref:BLUF domain-containing protein n=1 Tax=Maribacter sp. X9 TaxID=3402159 RepID=UPI003AF3DE96